MNKLLDIVVRPHPVDPFDERSCLARQSVDAVDFETNLSAVIQGVAAQLSAECDVRRGIAVIAQTVRPQPLMKYGEPVQPRYQWDCLLHDLDDIPLADVFQSLKDLSKR